MTQVPPGWYADPAAPPTGPPWLRWWDGYGWSSHVAPHDPAAVATPGPTTPDGVPLSGWWWRVLAYVIDAFVLGIPNAVLSLPAQLSMQRELQDTLRELETRSSAGRPPDLGAFFSDYMDVFREHVLWLFLPGALLITAYYAIMWRWRGASVGQLVTGLQVRPLAGPGRPTWPTALVRVSVLYLLPSAVMLVCLLSGSWTIAVVGYGAAFLFQTLNVLWPLWDGRRQALHDKAAGTVVTRPAR